MQNTRLKQSKEVQRTEEELLELKRKYEQSIRFVPVDKDPRNPCSMEIHLWFGSYMVKDGKLGVY